MSIYYSAIAQALLWAVMGVGMYISYRILRFADLTSEASFTTGAAVVVSLIMKDVNPATATLVAMLAGAVAGLITALLITWAKIPPLLAGIISLTGLYSINLRIMGRANISLRGYQTVFDFMASFLESSLAQRMVLDGAVLLVVVLILTYFFKTDIGQAIIATGDNEIMAKSIGVRTNLMKIVALMTANGLIALSGALIAQDNGVGDISVGTGTVVIALSSIVLGEVMAPNLTLGKRLLSVGLGSVVYRLILVGVLRLGFNPSDFKLISAAVLAIILSIPTLRDYYSQKKLKEANKLA